MARFAEPTEARAVFARAMGGEPVAEVFAMASNEANCWRHLDVRRVLDPVTGAPGLLLSEVDVTRRVRAEQARVSAEQETAMAQARERFLSEMSHELRTPLNAVIGFSDLLLQDGRLELAQTKQVASINAAGRDLQGVVDEMIRLSDLKDWNGDTASAVAELTTPSYDQTRPERSKAPAGAGSKWGGIRVLYVDDNATNRALVTTILAAQGIECETAENGSKGVQAACADVWDLILMDIQMPVMNGVEAAQAIRASPAAASYATPILAVTANTLPNQLKSYYAAGMNDCVAKPIDVASLLASVAYWSDPQPGFVESA